MPRKSRVFVSFDFDHDQKLKTFILAQAKNDDSPFEIENWSLNEPAPEALWMAKAKRRIARSDVVLVMVGPTTHRARGVRAEVAMARDLGIPVRQASATVGQTPPRSQMRGGCIGGAGRR